MLSAVGVLTVGALAFAVFGAGEAGPPSRFDVGRSFPDLLLPHSTDGRPISIADFRGRKLILHVFASW